MTQLISGLTGPATMSGGVPATSSGGSSPDLGFTLDQLINPTSAVDQTPQLTGGASSAPGFDPSLFTSGGVYGPTGSLSNAALGLPEVQQAVQDPAGQYPADQTVDRTNKADRATTPTDQQTVDRSSKSDLQTALGVPPAGPTGFTQPSGGGGGLTQLASAAGGGGGATPAQQVAGRFPTMPAQPMTPADAARAQQRATEAQPTEPAVPAPAAAPQPGAPGAPGAQRQAPGIPAPGGGRQAAPAAAAPAAGPPSPLQQAVQAAFGLGAPTTLGGIIPYLLQQLFGPGIPGMPGAPVAPFIAPPASAGSRWRRGLPSPEWRAAHGLPPDQTSNMTGDEQPNANIPAPASDSQVTAPTAAQIRQTVSAGTDTPPTEGFSNYLAQERSRFARELADPRVRAEVAAIASMEMDHDPAAVVESLMNRAAYAGTSLRNMIHSGFYAPVNKGQLPGGIMRLRRNPTLQARMNAGVETALRGSNLLGGATDQGSGNDPNVGHSGGRVRRFGEVYNDWGGGPGGHAGAARFRREQQSRVRNELNAGPQVQSQHDMGMQLAMDIGQRVPEMGSMLESDRGASAAARGGMRASVTPEPSQMNRLEEERRKRQPRREAVAL